MALLADAMHLMSTVLSGKDAASARVVSLSLARHTTSMESSDVIASELVQVYARDGHLNTLMLSLSFKIKHAATTHFLEDGTCHVLA